MPVNAFFKHLGNLATEVATKVQAKVVFTFVQEIPFLGQIVGSKA
jgi:hypothetical protein